MIIRICIPELELLQISSDSCQNRIFFLGSWLTESPFSSWVSFYLSVKLMLHTRRASLLEPCLLEIMSHPLKLCSLLFNSCRVSWFRNNCSGLFASLMQDDILLFILSTPMLTSEPDFEHEPGLETVPMLVPKLKYFFVWDWVK